MVVLFYLKIPLAPALSRREEKVNGVAPPFDGRGWGG
jgi:hypothetical protein